jgi:hypothetical protein
MSQQQNDPSNDAVRMAADPTKISAFDIIERNIMRDVETSRKSEFQVLETSGNQNTFGGLVARIGLETFDKYRNTVNRVASYVNQGYQMAVDHHNFLVRREELNDAAPLTSGPNTAVPQGEITFSPYDISTTAGKTANFDSKIPAEVVRLLTMSLIIMDAGGAQDSNVYKQQALALVERNVTTSVEKTRRHNYQNLASNNTQNTFGGLCGRIGLETVARYRLSESRVKSYINQAYQAAVDHYNFVARRENYHQDQIVFAPLSGNSDAFNPLIPAEVIRLIVLSYIQNDNAGVATAGPMTAMAEQG